jgi:DNA-binding SARP family transcriptional activator
MPRPGRRLLARLQRARPKLLVLIAPAGYGKSTLARYFAEGRAHAVCDCGLAQGRAEFIRRVLATLAQVLPEARLNLQRAQLVLGSEAEERFGIEAALEAWAAPCDDSLFIFENVEKLLETGAGEDLLARFLASRPENRVVVICSRLPLRVRLTRFAAPHEIVTLHAADLALTPEETLSFFPRLKPEAAASVVALCRGWPIAVLLLARFAREGSLEEVLARSGDLPSGELYEYLWDEVLASAGIQSLPGLLACALLPGATPRELAWALDDDARRVEAFAAWAGTLPLIGLTAGSTYEAHPLVRATLETRFPQRRRELLLDMAARQREHGDAPRAAELYLAAGEQRRAAEALDELPVSAAQSTPEFLPMLAAIEPAVLEQFPLLWMHAHAERRFSTSPQSLLDEIREIARRLPKEIDAERRFTVLRLLVVALGRVGKDREAETLVERYREQTGAPGVPRDVAEASLLHLSGYLALRAGRLSAWERVRSAIEPFFEASPPLAEAVLTERASYELPMLGRFSEAADVIRRLIARTRERGSKAPEISFLFGLSVSAWLNGDEPAFAQSVAEMRELADRARTPGTEFFLACAQGRTGATAGPLDSLHSRVWGHLIACGFAKTREVAGHHARLGDEAAAELGLPFTRVLTALARAECSPSERAAALGELARLAGLSESQPLREAVESYLAGRPDATGMLAPTLRRFRELALAEREEIELALFTGTVSRNGKELHLADRELQLLFALARRQAPLHRDALGDLLWPESDGDAARKALKACVYRVRRRLGEEHAIAGGERGYQLGPGVRVDLWRAEAWILELRGRTALDAVQRAELEELYRALARGLPAFTNEWEWFAPTARRIDELRVELAERLAESAIRAGDANEALRLAREIGAYDPHDETGCSIAVRALQAQRDALGAQREFRRYCERLAREVGAEPSRALRELVAKSAAR